MFDQNMNYELSWPRFFGPPCRVYNILAKSVACENRKQYGGSKPEVVLSSRLE
jgi:hypothetical protein